MRKDSWKVPGKNFRGVNGLSRLETETSTQKRSAPRPKGMFAIWLSRNKLFQRNLTALLSGSTRGDSNRGGNVRVFASHTWRRVVHNGVNEGS